ncbi:hypothetical protein AC1031_011777 [Aphanomyces cochlioides]|nr:hypothetical protein AC1031_011777 [Aphanomyces cochlioides]
MPVHTSGHAKRTRHGKRTNLCRGNKLVQIEKADITNPRYQGKHIADEAEVEIFRGRDPYTPTSATLHCATVDLAGTIEEVAHFYRTDTNEDVTDLIERVGHGLLDAINFYSIKDSPETKVRLQWVLEKNPFDDVVKKRDYCTLESTFLFDPAENGRRTWVRCLKSIQIPCCPEFPSVIRAVQYGSGIICRETHRPGYLELISVVHFDLCGSLPFAIKEVAAKELCRTIRHIDRHLREDRLSASPFLMGGQFVELSSRKRCYLCKRHFGPFLRKRNCFKCGEVVCTKCGPKWNVKAGGTALKVSACTACSLHAQSSSEGDTSSVVSGFTTPSSASSTAVWRIADDDSDDDYESSVASFETDDSSMSHYSNSTGGRSTFDHSEG